MATPHVVLRAVQRALALVSRGLYRLRARGLESVPAAGPALLVANHVTYADSLILAGLLGRPVRFLVDHRVHDTFGLRPFFRLVRAIPIAPRSEDPTRLEAAMEEVHRALEAGELVGIFPEGSLTRTGEIEAFRAGVDRILERAPVPVVPVALRGLWGSRLSRARAAPRRLRRRVEVVVGEALEPDVGAEAIREVVCAMRGAVR